MLATFLFTILLYLKMSIDYNERVIIYLVRLHCYCFTIKKLVLGNVYNVI